MGIIFLLYLNIIFSFCSAKLPEQNEVALNLEQRESDEHFQIEKTNHFGLDSVEFYLRKPFLCVSVTEGELVIWKRLKNENMVNAVMYFAGEPLSLLYIKLVDDKKETLKYYAKVKGQWMEVMEALYKFFLELDRKNYTSIELDKMANGCLETVTPYVFKFSFFLPKSYQPITTPIYDCQLDIPNPDNSFIMEQCMIGPTFGYIYTPRIDFGINRITYHGTHIWISKDNKTICTSVWTHFKGIFPEIMVINLYNIETHTPSFIGFKRKDDLLFQISNNELKKTLIKMTLAEYDETDIECYKDGFLKLRDSSFTFKTFSAILIIITSILYTQCP